MAFFQRIISYLANEVIVNGLANRHAAAAALRSAMASRDSGLFSPPPSRTFQRFAIRTDAALREAHVTGKDQATTYLQQGLEFAQASHSLARSRGRSRRLTPLARLSSRRF